MEQDIDTKLYNDYLNGEKKARLKGMKMDF